MRLVALVLRPEPGNAATVARLAALGVEARSCPLFVVTPVRWEPPDPARYEALLLTSASAVRHAGPGLANLHRLPVVAVGATTAAAARTAGFDVALTGDANGAAAVERARALGRVLHLAGRERVSLCGLDQLTVYASDPVSIDRATVESWRGHLALLHSPRAARRFAELVDAHALPRAAIAVAALSKAVAQAAGEGWATIAAAPRPDDAALTALALALVDQPEWRADKHGR